MKSPKDELADQGQGVKKSSVTEEAPTQWGWQRPEVPPRATMKQHAKWTPGYF
jgi:hypothetical protein